ncbi:CaaX protease [Biscogniauxia mediterranea]|nr:CaaX protease [Biscogniauxia mediterranea]
MPSITSFLTQYFTKEEPKPPPITTATAAALLVIYTFIYVVPFYLSPKTRPSRTLSRDAPSVIRARITSVSLTCIVCSVITLVILTSEGQASYGEALHLMGYWPVGLVETGKCLLLTAILFSGPLYETLVVDGAWREWCSLQPVSRLFSEWTLWRNIVAGPFTEEVLFRSASVPLMLVARTSVSRTVFLSPVIFGLAHFHHFYEFRLSHPHVPVAGGLLRSLVQFAYTSLFGAYATFLFLRSGSLLAIFAVHAFCNVMGLPRFWGRVDPPPPPPEVAAGAGGRPPSVLWTVVYYVLLVGGAASWWRLLGPLTESGNALVPIDI